MDTEDLRQRIGKIKISEPFFWDLKSCCAILRDCIVLKVELGVRTYVVACPEFDRLADGEAVPEYVACVNMIDGSYVERGKWERVT